MYAEGALTGGGLGHYDNIELWRRLAGESVNFNFSVEEDGFFFTGDSSPDKVERLLQVIAAFITDPAFRPEGYQASLSRIQGIYPPLYREPTQFLGWVCPTVLAGGDTRYGLVPLDKFSQRTPAEVEGWLKPVLAHGAMELGIAGDLEVEDVMSAVSRTLGALPEWRAAGQTSRAEALRRCAPDWSFGGGPAVMGQWVQYDRDRNVTCPTATGRLTDYFGRP